MARLGARTSTRTITGAAAAVTAVAAFGLSACTLGPEKGDAGGQERQASRAMTFELDAEGVDAVKVSVPDEPVATTKASTPGMAFELYLLQRSDKVVNVVFAMHNTGDEEVDAIDATRDLDEEPSALEHNASNVSLVDTTGLKEYRSFITEGNGDCLCSTTYDIGATNDFAPDERQYFVVQVAAPPASVERVTVLAHVASLPGQTIEG